MTHKQLILRLNSARELLGISRSTFYQQIKDGLITKPVQIGLRAVGWPSSEINNILYARIAGKALREIRDLVQELEHQRNSMGGK